MWNDDGQPPLMGGGHQYPPTNGYSAAPPQMHSAYMNRGGIPPVAAPMMTSSQTAAPPPQMGGYWDPSQMIAAPPHPPPQMTMQRQSSGYGGRQQSYGGWEQQQMQQQSQWQSHPQQNAQWTAQTMGMMSTPPPAVMGGGMGSGMGMGGGRLIGGGTMNGTQSGYFNEQQQGYGMMSEGGHSQHSSHHSHSHQQQHHQHHQQPYSSHSSHSQHSQHNRNNWQNEQQQQQQQQQQFNSGFQNGQQGFQSNQQQTNQWGQPIGQGQNGLGVTGQQPMSVQMNGNQMSGQFRPGYGTIATAVKAASPSIANVNSPSKLSSNQVNGAQVDIRITAYSNPNNLVSNTTTCSCASNNCDFLPTANQQNACKFAFVTIISSADQSVQYYSTDFFQFNQQMDPRVGNWSNPISFQMTTKPVAIDVFVYQLGVAITLPDPVTKVQTLAYYDRLMLVDSFVVNVFAYNASMGTPVNDVLPGKIIGTSMSIAWSVKCINGMLGNNCNLICGVTPDAYATTEVSPNARVIPPLRTAVSDGTTLCKDIVSGIYASCIYNAGRTQVVNCVTCVNGVTPNNTCNSVFTDVTQDDMVSYAFRTWTIVLGCLLGLAILVIFCLIISYIIVRNREKEEVEYKEYKPNPYNLPPAQQTPASRPLLDDEWQTAPRRPIQPPLPPHQQEHDRASDDSYRNGHMAAQSTQSRQEH